MHCHVVVSKMQYEALCCALWWFAIRSSYHRGIEYLRIFTAVHFSILFILSAHDRRHLHAISCAGDGAHRERVCRNSKDLVLSRVRAEHYDSTRICDVLYTIAAGEEFCYVASTSTWYVLSKRRRG